MSDEPIFGKRERALWRLWDYRFIFTALFSVLPTGGAVAVWIIAILNARLNSIVHSGPTAGPDVNPINGTSGYTPPPPGDYEMPPMPPSWETDPFAVDVVTMYNITKKPIEAVENILKPAVTKLETTMSTMVASFNQMTLEFNQLLGWADNDTERLDASFNRGLDRVLTKAEIIALSIFFLGVATYIVYWGWQKAYAQQYERLAKKTDFPSRNYATGKIAPTTQQRFDSLDLYIAPDLGVPSRYHVNSTQGPFNRWFGLGVASGVIDRIKSVAKEDGGHLNAAALGAFVAQELGVMVMAQRVRTSRSQLAAPANFDAGTPEAEILTAINRALQGVNGAPDLARRRRLIVETLSAMAVVQTTTVADVRNSVEYKIGIAFRQTLDQEDAYAVDQQSQSVVAFLERHELPPVLLRKFLLGLFEKDLEAIEEVNDTAAGFGAAAYSEATKRVKANGLARFANLPVAWQTYVVQALCVPQRDAANGHEPDDIRQRYFEVAQFFAQQMPKAYSPVYFRSWNPATTPETTLVLSALTFFAWSAYVYFENKKTLALILAIPAVVLTAGIGAYLAMRFCQRWQTNQIKIRRQLLSGVTDYTCRVKNIARIKASLRQKSALHASQTTTAGQRQSLALEINVLSVQLIEAHRANVDVLPAQVFSLYFNALNVDYEAAFGQEGAERNLARANIVSCLLTLTEASSDAEIKTLVSALSTNDNARNLFLRWYWGDPAVADWAPKMTDALRAKIFAALPNAGQGFIKASLFPPQGQGPTHNIQHADWNRWIGHCMLNSAAKAYKRSFGALQCFLPEMAQQVAVALGQVLDADVRLAEGGYDQAQAAARTRLAGFTKCFSTANAVTRKHFRRMMNHSPQLKNVCQLCFWRAFDPTQWVGARRPTASQCGDYYKSFASVGADGFGESHVDRLWRAAEGDLAGGNQEERHARLAGRVYTALKARLIKRCCPF